MKLKLIQRKELWWPTWKGWVLGFVTVLGVGLSAFHALHGFLAVNGLVESNVVVVEGWISDHAIADGKALFERGGYEKLLVAGCPLDRGAFLQEFQTYAGVGAATLRAMGFDGAALIEAPAGEARRNRTYHSAVAAREALEQAGITVAGVDVVTLATHARRSRMVYRKVFGPEVSVGVLAVPPTSYDPKRWWASSEGLKTTVVEAVAFFFERLADGGRSSRN